MNNGNELREICRKNTIMTDLFVDQHNIRSSMLAEEGFVYNSEYKLYHRVDVPYSNVTVSPKDLEVEGDDE